jgi:hypothetical protein
VRDTPFPIGRGAELKRAMESGQRGDIRSRGVPEKADQPPSRGDAGVRPTPDLQIRRVVQKSTPDSGHPTGVIEGIPQPPHPVESTGDQSLGSRRRLNRWNSSRRPGDSACRSALQLQASRRRYPSQARRGHHRH